MSAYFDRNAHKFMRRAVQPDEVAPSRWVKHWSDAVDRSIHLQKRVMECAALENPEIESFHVVCGFAWKTT